MFASNTIWLWGLLGLLVPLAIHLLSRKESKVIKVGSIRFFEDVPTMRFKTLRLNQILLLILRCVIISLIVAVLADVVIETSSTNKKWLVIEKGIEKTNEFKRLYETLTESGFEIRWLAENFPAFSDSLFNQRISYWQLAKSLNTAERDCVIVLSYNYLRHFRGLREPNSGINWITIMPSSSSKEVSVRSRSSVLEAKKVSTPFYTTTDLKEASPTQQRKQDPKQDTIHVVVVFDDAFSMDRNIITAAVEAISKMSPIPVAQRNIHTKNFKPSKEKVIFWLSDQDYPWEREEKSSIIGTCFEVKNIFPLLVEHNSFATHCKSPNFTWLLTKRLTEENAINEHLIRSLIKILFPVKANHSGTNDVTIVPETAMWSEDERNMTSKKMYEEISGHLVMLIIFLCTIERLIAFMQR